MELMYFNLTPSQLPLALNLIQLKILAESVRAVYKTSLKAEHIQTEIRPTTPPVHSSCQQLPTVQ